MENQNGFTPQQRQEAETALRDEGNSFVQQEMAREKGIQRDAPTTGGSVLLGVICAVIGAALGGLVWVLISRLGYIAGIAGFLTMFFAMKGYNIGSRRQIGKGGTVLCFLLSLVVLYLANCASYAVELYTVFKKEAGVTVPFFDCVKMLPEILREPEIAGAFTKDLVVGILLSVLACAGTLVRTFKKPKQQSPQDQNPQ
jgi:hypothetical protein